MQETIFRVAPHTESTRSDRSAKDRARHRQLVRENIKNNLPDILADESLIGRDKNTIVKIPLKSIREFRFVYGDNQPNVGTGDGNSQEGQVVGKTGKEGQGKGDGQAGDKAGQDIIETEITLAELIDLMFQDCKLPNLRKTSLRQIIENRNSRKLGYRKVGIPVRLSKVKSAIERVKRKKATQRFSDLTEECKECEGVGCETCEQTGVVDRRFPFRKQDLRYVHHEDNPKPQSNAAIIFVMDCSGSMDNTKKYLARSFMYYFYEFIRANYDKSAVVFVSFHTEAKEVDENTFFHKGESGGTFISSGLDKAIEIIKDRLSPELWNNYVLFTSDGDNFDSDNPKAIKAVQELKELCSLVGYAEIKPTGSNYYESSMLGTFKPFTDKDFKCVAITSKEDVWAALKDILTIGE